jgi:hypothetical protein
MDVIHRRFIPSAVASASDGFPEENAAAGFGELRAEPGLLIDALKRNRKARDYFPRILENESRD